jgi:hypothetical protein
VDLVDVGHEPSLAAGGELPLALALDRCDRSARALGRRAGLRDRSRQPDPGRVAELIERNLDIEAKIGSLTNG